MHAFNAILALSALVASATASPARLNRRQVQVNGQSVGSSMTSDSSCFMNGGSPAALIKVENRYACGCASDVNLRQDTVSVTLCEGTAPYKLGNPADSNYQQNVCRTSNNGASGACSVECLGNAQRNPGNGACVLINSGSSSAPSSSKPSSISSTPSSSVVTTSSPTSYYCGLGTSDGGKCNPPPSTTTPPPYSSTSYSTTFCLGSGTASGNCFSSASSTSSAPVSSVTGAAQKNKVGAAMAAIALAAVAL